MFVVRTSKLVENLRKKKGLFWSRYSFVTFYRAPSKRLRARKIGLQYWQYKIRKGRKQIWGRFSNPWNSNGIEWNRLILLTWSRILMYLPNTVGKRHKKVFKFINRVLFPDSTRTTYTRDLHAQEKKLNVKMWRVWRFWRFWLSFRVKLKINFVSQTVFTHLKGVRL